MGVEEKISQKPFGMTLDRNLKFDERMQQVTVKVNKFISLKIYTYFIGLQIYTYFIGLQIYTYFIGLQIYNYFTGLQIYNYFIGLQI